MSDIYDSPAFDLIKVHYGTRQAERSGLPLINHIIEGLAIMQAHAPGEPYLFEAQQAFCLHPMLQTDGALASWYHEMRFQAPLAVLFATEYRWRANNWLSDKVSKLADNTLHTDGTPQAGDLYPVRLMLIADKVQNYKDFIAHHVQTHERSRELSRYFHAWFDHLELKLEDVMPLAITAQEAMEKYHAIHSPHA